MSISAHIEEALAIAGRDNVFRRDNATPSIAIRWQPPQRPPPNDPWIVMERGTLDEAGEAAAREFAKRIRAHAEAIAAQADRIDALLSRKP